MVEYEYDTFAFDQAIAQGTERVVTGSCVARSFTRHPLLTAETAAVIDRLAPGRFVIGLGNGGVSEPKGGDAARAQREVDPSISLQRWGTGADRPVARMREYIEVIRRALSGQTTGYDGEFYRFEDVGLSVTATGHVPIYLGARRNGMLALGGEAADGVFLWLVGEAETRRAIAHVERARANAGRPAGSVRMGCLIPTCVSTDSAAARGAMRRHLVTSYLGRSVYANVLAETGFPDAGERVRELCAAGKLIEAAGQIPDAALDEIAVAGDPDECRERITRWHEIGVENRVLYLFPVDEDWPRAYAEAIADLAPGR
jgi:alkanesulfonate monooxygenase SsuD/methylene tetrahydromethanopterin reductase-like flavin-dependent oxidoreductase (luciferase family)